jgi:hypothetical protein
MRTRQTKYQGYWMRHKSQGCIIRGAGNLHPLSAFHVAHLRQPQRQTCQQRTYSVRYPAADFRPCLSSPASLPIPRHALSGLVEFSGKNFSLPPGVPLFAALGEEENRKMSPFRSNGPAGIASFLYAAQEGPWQLRDSRLGPICRQTCPCNLKCVTHLGTNEPHSPGPCNVLPTIWAKDVTTKSKRARERARWTRTRRIISRTACGWDEASPWDPVGLGGSITYRPGIQSSDSSTSDGCVAGRQISRGCQVREGA